LTTGLRGGAYSAPRARPLRRPVAKRFEVSLRSSESSTVPMRTTFPFEVPAKEGFVSPFSAQAAPGPPANRSGRPFRSASKIKRHGVRNPRAGIPISAKRHGGRPRHAPERPSSRKRAGKFHRASTARRCRPPKNGERHGGGTTLSRSVSTLSARDYCCPGRPRSAAPARGGWGTPDAGFARARLCRSGWRARSALRKIAIEYPPDLGARASRLRTATADCSIEVENTMSRSRRNLGATRDDCRQHAADSRVSRSHSACRRKGGVR